MRAIVAVDDGVRIWTPLGEETGRFPRIEAELGCILPPGSTVQGQVVENARFIADGILEWEGKDALWMSEAIREELLGLVLERAMPGGIIQQAESTIVDREGGK